MIHELLLIQKLPNFILEIFNNDMEELSKHISVLDSTKAQGIVYKIHVEGNLEQDGYESAFLYLPKGSSIKNHEHTKDFERYILVFGDLKVNGNRMAENECHINESHCIDTVLTDTLVCTYKQKQNVKKLLPSTNIIR